MKRFIQGQDRSQSTLFPELLEDYMADDNTVRVVDAYVDELDLRAMGFERVQLKATGRPSYHPSILSSFIFTATSIAFNQAVVWNGKRVVM